ncbi:MAG: flagellar motor switch protein FliN [Calditrichaeota bacterium]|nr:MAG: flagellar motor switch protein FliN [Calditrichota bacterium]MBL1204016.1 flagellar motor switch protein FliN [Calditrichota bacterium]NOG43847.1 flagellar motor switch protein FliN [Calditrichota bacterium]
MANRYFQERVEQNINDVQSVINNALNQILNREFEFSLEFSDQADINPIITAESYPSIAVTFTSGPDHKTIQHIILLEPAFLLKFYAWMLMDEPAEEVSDDHFDGLKEGLEQVFGQLKMAVADEKGNFNITGLEVFPAETFDAVNEKVIEGEGSFCNYSLTTEGETYQLKQFMWPENPEMFVEQENPMTEMPQVDDLLSNDPVDIQSAEFGNISYSGTTPGDPQNVSMLLDVELEIRVEIDRKKILVSDLLKLGKGSIVEMDKSAGEPLDVFVNGRKFAEGEVVVVDDRFGIRITQLISPKERVKSLGQAI